MMSVTSGTVSRWERGTQTISDQQIRSLHALYDVEQAMRAVDRVAEGLGVPSGPSGKRRLNPAPYKRVHEYLEKMREAGMPEGAIDEAERYMVNSNFGVLNKRDYRERSDDEVIGDIDMMWGTLKMKFERDYGITL